MEGKAFLEIAKKLVQMRTEPALRSAVGRAYYATYNCCVQFLVELGFQFGNEASTHEKVYQYLKNSTVKEIAVSADTLRELRKRRNQADYDMKSKQFENHITCQLDLASAQMIISQIEKNSQEPFRTQLKNGLREYHAKINP